jgi:hypothetical protein
VSVTLPAVYRPGFTPLTGLTLTLDGWTGPGTDTNGAEWWLSRFDGWYGTPGVRLGTADRPQDHGLFDGPSYYGGRVITAQGTTIAPDQATALLCCDILSSLCSDPSQTYTLQVTEPGRPTRRCQVRLNADIKVSDIYYNAFDWQIALLAPDPRRYADSLTQFTLIPPASGGPGGFTFPIVFPLVIPTSGVSSSTWTATNNGTIATRPVVTMVGPLVDPQIANLTTGRTLAMTITLASTDTLVVDFDKRSITLNGTASRTSALVAGAAWWDLPPGQNLISLAAGGGAGTATVAFRSAWI